MIDAFNRLHTAMTNLAVTMEEFDEAMKQNMKASDNPTLKVATTITDTIESPSNVTSIADPVAATEDQSETEPKKKPARKKLVAPIVSRCVRVFIWAGAIIAFAWLCSRVSNVPIVSLRT